MSCKLFKVQNLGGGKLKVINLCDASASPTYISSMSDFYNLNIPFDSISIPNFKEESDLEKWVCEVLTAPIEVTFPEEEPQKEFQGTSEYYSNSEKDLPDHKKEIFCFDRWFDGTEICYVQTGSIPDGSNLITIENYTKMSLTSTPPVSENLMKYLVPAYGVICIPPATTITMTDVLAHAIANGGAAYDGSVPTGLLNTSGTPLHAGLMAFDANGDLKKVGTSFVKVNNQPINAGTPWCPKEQPPQDEDCDGFLKGELLTIEIENVSADKSVAFAYNTCLIKGDADDTDETVQ